VQFTVGEGPQLDAIADRRSLARLKPELDHGILAPIYETIKRIKADLPPAVALLGFCGLAIAAAGIRNFSRARTPVPTNEPTRALVTTGIHGWTRNPIYLGMFLMYGGIGIAVRSPSILILALPLAIRHPLRGRRARGGVSGTALWRHLPRLQSPRSPLV
jgi:Phospholipid methyltransferase